MVKSIFLALIIFSISRMIAAAPIKISDTSDLDFGVSVPGDSAKTVPPSNSENASNGSFRVTGDASRAYTIVLPSGPVTLQYKQGPTTDTMTVSSFASFPANTGLLNASGIQNLFIGATRASLKQSQLAGTYTGSYSITVVY